jgi:hypothetical protein
MKKSLIFILIFLFIFSFSCTFNLFEGTVESNYKSIKTPSEKIEYAQQILAAGDSEKIKVIIDLLKADITAGIFNSDPKLKVAANQIVGNLIIADSGFNDYIANAISEVINPTEGSNPDLLTAILDSNGDGVVDTNDMEAFVGMATTLGYAAGYINTAAAADTTNVDLQFQNVIANFAAAIITVSNELSDPTAQQEFQNYLENGGTPPFDLSTIQKNLNNIKAFVNNMLANTQEGTFYYDIASTLNAMFSGLTT